MKTQNDDRLDAFYLDGYLIKLALLLLDVVNGWKWFCWGLALLQLVNGFQVFCLLTQARGSRCIRARLGVVYNYIYEILRY